LQSVQGNRGVRRLTGRPSKTSHEPARTTIPQRPRQEALDGGEQAVADARRAAHFPKGNIFREDRPPVPAEALRETIVNAVIHRDYSRSASYVAIAVFDDRIEVRSMGDFPTGISAAMLSQEHPSVLRNPLIAGAFHRTGAVEVWGSGTNRVIGACRRYGIAPPEYSEMGGVVTVTFRTDATLQPEPAPDGHQAGTKSGPSSSP